MFAVQTNLTSRLPIQPAAGLGMRAGYPALVGHFDDSAIDP